jgi:hypothetical protein
MDRQVQGKIIGPQAQASFLVLLIPDFLKHTMIMAALAMDSKCLVLWVRVKIILP